MAKQSYRFTPGTRLLLHHAPNGQVYLFRFAPNAKPRRMAYGALISPRHKPQHTKGVAAERLLMSPGGYWSYERTNVHLHDDGRVRLRSDGTPQSWGATAEAFGRMTDEGDSEWRGGSEVRGDQRLGLRPREAQDLFGNAVDELLEIAGQLSGERFPDGTYS